MGLTSVVSRTSPRIAVIGQGAIGRLVADTLLLGSVEVVRVDRSRSAVGALDHARADFALICVKTSGTIWAAEIARRLLEPEGVGVTLQNGIGNLEVLAAALGSVRACAGSVHTGAYRDAADRVIATGPLRLSLARGEAGEQIETLAVVLRAAGAEVTLVDRPAPLLWRKVVVSAAVNPVTAILGLPNGALPDHLPGALLADALAREAARVAVVASGIALTEADARRLWREAARATATNLSSMLQDVRAHRVTEIDAICGAVAREGARAGVPAPLNLAMALLMHALEPPG